MKMLTFETEMSWGGEGGSKSQRLFDLGKTEGGLFFYFGSGWGHIRKECVGEC